MRRSANTSIDSNEYVLPKKYRNEEEQSYKPRRKSFSKYIVDFNEGTFLTRTTLSWLKIVLYFIIFYCVICGFFVANYIVFQRQLGLDKPRYVREQPGLSFAPNVDDNAGHPKIEYDADDAVGYQSYVRAIDKFLAKFSSKGRTHFSQCNGDGKWGYKSGEPCVFLKINRILGWHAITYTSVGSMPKEVPLDVKTAASDMSQEEMQDRVWVSCTYQKNLVQDVEYFPGPYVIKKYLQYDVKKFYKETEMVKGEAYTKNREYFSKRDYERIVAVIIKKPKRGVAVKFNCNAWAMNIKRGDNNEDMVTFTIQIN